MSKIDEILKLMEGQYSVDYNSALESRTGLFHIINFKYDQDLILKDGKITLDFNQIEIEIKGLLSLDRKDTKGIKMIDSLYEDLKDEEFIEMFEHRTYAAFLSQLNLSRPFLNLEDDQWEIYNDVVKENFISRKEFAYNMGEALKSKLDKLTKKN